MNIRDYLKENILLTDGAMGTYFDEIAPEHYLCSEEANLFAPDEILGIHRAYIEAGARLIRSNTFSANKKTFARIQQKQGKAAEKYTFSSFVQAGYRLARQAAEEAADRGVNVFPAADIGPIWEDSESTMEEVMAEYFAIADAFLDIGADVFVLETFPDEQQVLAIARHIRERLPDAFVIGQFSFSPTGYSRTGFHYRTVIKKAVESGILNGVGLNCGIGAAHMKKFLSSCLDEFGIVEGIAFTALPNCGYPQIVRGRAVYSDSVPYFGDKVLETARLGVRILGGCCGTTPEYIREIANRLSGETQNFVSEVSYKGKKGSKPQEHSGKERDNLPLYKGQESKKLQIYQKKEEKSIEAGRQEDLLQPSQKMDNSFRNKLENGEKVCAVELDPPFDASTEKLMKGAGQLAGSRADIITIADSPLARSRADSLLTAVKIQRETGIQVMPHLACRDRNRIALRSGVLGAHINDIRNLLIVTGDPVGREEREFTKSVFDFNSIRLMQFMSSLNEELFSGDEMFFGGALNQNGASPDKIAERMKKKMDAGCQFFLTQPVYSEKEIDRLSYLQNKTGAKILIGVMPLVSYRNALFIKNEMPGIYVPDAVLGRYAPEDSREEWEQTAIDISEQMIALGKEVGAGYYFMTPFHRVSLIKKILDSNVWRT